MEACKKILGFFIFTGCVGIPNPPQISMCMYDNYSVSEKTKRDYSNSPVFHCIASNQTEYDVEWNSKSAKNMVSMPHDDYVKLNAYYKKLFYIFEREFLNRKGR